ncbi:MAG: FxsA family protein, partial [Candidatus Aenigmatarchaeota archaeon]
MIPLLILLFVVLPLIDLFLLVKLAGIIGLLETVLLVVFTGIVGASMVRKEGLNVLRRLQHSV